MPDDLTTGEICVRLYADNVLHDRFWDRLWPQNGGYVGLKHTADADVIVWRGSTTVYDWLLNFDALPEADPDLGMLHAGFARGVRPVQDAITAAVQDRPVIVTGHSRGAAQACIFAGHMVARGHPPVRLMVMGCPRPGYQKLADVLHTGGVEIHSYKNHGDPVTDVPFNIDLIGTACDLPYVQVAPFIPLPAPPGAEISLDPLAAHHWRLYMQGLRRMFAKPDAPRRGAPAHGSG